MKWLPVFLALSLILSPALSASFDVEIGTNVTLYATASGMSLVSEPVGYNVTSISVNDTHILLEYPAYQNETGDYWEANETLDLNETRFSATTYDFPCLRDRTCSRAPLVLIGTIIPFVLLSMVYAIYWRKKR